MKPTLQLRLSQQLTLTPQLQQSIKLLQLSTLELNQEVEKYLLENPFLEREEPEAAQENPENETDSLRESGNNQEEGRGTTSLEQAQEEIASTIEAEPDVFTSLQNDAKQPLEPELVNQTNSDLDWLFTAPSQSTGGDDEESDSFATQYPHIFTLRDHLIRQLGLLKLADKDRGLAIFIIDTLNEDGYLTQSLEEAMLLLPPDLEVTLEDLQVALKYVQSLEPIGIGARSLSECLTLQLDALPDNVLGRTLARAIVKENLEALAARDFSRMRKTLSCNDEELKAAQELIKKLNPKPGLAFAANDTRYVIPDVIVEKIKNVWMVTLNEEAVPRLKINPYYVDVLKNNRGISNVGGTKLSSQLQEARWLVKNVQQRFDTILRVSQAIVDRQRNFFEQGEVAMRPLVLREIADSLGLHESTVSRVTTQKYMLAPRGTYELKYFFSSHVATDTGGACSATAIRAMIKELIGAENKKKPISDNELSKILGRQGIVVARRTIAKYRESMNIPPASLRKSL